MTRFPWRTLLFISLALNLLIVGAVAGAWGAGVRLQREANARAVVERMPGPRAFLRALPPETRAMMRQRAGGSWGESREARRARDPSAPRSLRRGGRRALRRCARARGVRASARRRPSGDRRLP